MVVILKVALGGHNVLISRFIFRVLIWCLYVASVLRHCWLGIRKGVW